MHESSLHEVRTQLQYNQHRYLSVPSGLHHGHDDVLRGHEGQLMADVSLNDFGVDHQSLCDVLQGGEDDVRCQEGLGQGDPPARMMRATGSNKLRNFLRSLCF